MTKDFPDYPDDSASAYNVQCIHCSDIYGTTKTDCTQDWLMGECGIDQKANPLFGITYLLSFNHIICTEFYVNAFTVNFPATLENNQICLNDGRQASAQDLQDTGGYYNMGYLQIDKR